MFKCNGTLHVIYRRGGNHSFIVQKPHKCTVGHGERGEPDNWIPMVVIKPNINWGIRKEKLMEVKQDLELIAPLVKNYIVKMYPKVDKFSVGALRSKGGKSQYKLSGVYYQDYLQDVVNNRIQDERPFSIILALENEIMDEEVETVCVPIGHVAFFQVH
jgi:hypothetical protein